MAEVDDMLAACAVCGRNVPVSDTCEARFVASGALCEFFHCADREACEQHQDRIARGIVGCQTPPLGCRIENA